MNITRRNLGFNATTLAGLLALAGCGVLSTSNGTITVNLATAQAEANTIETAILAEYTNVKSLLPASAVTAINTYLPDLQTATTVFTNLPSGTVSYKSAAEAFLKVVGEVVPLLTPVLGPATVLAINAGVGIVSALVAGLPAVTAPPAVVEAGISAVKVVPGPIAIPLS